MPAVAVIDIGKTNQKAFAFDRDGAVLAVERAAVPTAGDPPYRHLDTEALWQWILAALGALGATADIEAIVVTAFGSTAALVDNDGLILPIADYEAEPPASVAAAYDRVAPPFAEVFAPTNPAGLTLGRQLFWLRETYADAFGRATAILLHPQYWAWRLAGVAATEVTSLGAQTHLWDPIGRRPSSLVDRLGWAGLLPPMRPAWAPLGPILPAVAAATGLKPGTAVLCGIHDSNANYLRYRTAGLGAVTLMSTGTWLITFNPGGDLAALDPARDTNTNTDAFGEPVACSRFMIGREYDLAGGGRVVATWEAVARVVAAGARILPSLTDSGGPVPGSGGRGGPDGPAPADAAEDEARALLYIALMSDAALDAVGSVGPMVIDGGFADNPLYAGLIAALRPGQPVSTARQGEGTAVGAALLWRWGERPPPALPLAPVTRPEIPGLSAYAAAWRTAAMV